MANSNTPFGLKPISTIDGGAIGPARVYCIPNTEDTYAYAMGDPVTLAGGADAAGVPTVVLATAGSGLLGVIVSMGGRKYGGAHVDYDSINSVTIPVTKDRDYYVMVVDDPDTVFEVQEIGTGTQLAAADVGLNCNLVAGTNNGYVSGWLLTNTTENTTSTLDVQLLGLVQRPGNAFGAYAKWRVRINNHKFNAGITGL